MKNTKVKMISIVSVFKFLNCPKFHNIITVLTVRAVLLISYPYLVPKFLIM